MQRAFSNKSPRWTSTLRHFAVGEICLDAPSYQSILGFDFWKFVGHADFDVYNEEEEIYMKLEF